jgi:hypothetical protein
LKICSAAIGSFLPVAEQKKAGKTFTNKGSIPASSFSGQRVKMGQSTNLAPVGKTVIYIIHFFYSHKMLFNNLPSSWARLLLQVRERSASGNPSAATTWRNRFCMTLNCASRPAKSYTRSYSIAIN